MPTNQQYIQPPSFDGLGNDTATYQESSYNDNTYADPVPMRDTQLTESISSQADTAYSVPLSIVVDTGGAWFGFFTVALAISAIIFTVILYSLFRVIQIRLVEKEHFSKESRSTAVELLLGHKDTGETSVSENSNKRRWQQITEHVQSGSQGDWRLAILEADIMLDDLMNSLGYTGDGLGEKLKQVRQEDINSVEAAWEAHKIRNKIAHEGTAHELNYREVKRVVSLYKQVFTETNFI